MDYRFLLFALCLLVPSGATAEPRRIIGVASVINWAEHYKVIVVYPAIEPSASLSEEACQVPPLDSAIDEFLVHRRHDVLILFGEVVFILCHARLHHCLVWEDLSRFAEGLIGGDQH